MKNLLKSIFISLFPIFAFFGLFLGINQIVIGNVDMSTIGLSILSATIILLFGSLFLVPKARTNRYLPVYSLILIIGFLMGFSKFLFDSNPTFEFFISILLFISWILYLFWYSVLDHESGTLFEIGKQIPDLLLENSDQKKISIRSFIGAPTIFMFYRGNWCPLCMAQIKEIASQYEELEKAGINVVLISPQPHKFSRSLANKYNLGFHFLTDVDHKAAKQFGIFTNYGIPAGFQLLGYESDSVLPTIIITDSNGTIIFYEIADNYRVRPEPKTFLRVIEKHQEGS
jgi:peroxiredoxin